MIATRLKHPKLGLIETSGFTLIELVTVIVLLAIVSATALPKFMARSNFDQKVLFNDTLNALRYAQRTAIASGCNVRFSIIDNRYHLLRANTCQSDLFSDGLTVQHPSNGETAYTGHEKNVSLSATRANTTFDNLGRADADNTITIGTFQITVLAATGFSFDSSP
jgi:MSHA pilin protein MshC